MLQCRLLYGNLDSNPRTTFRTTVLITASHWPFWKSFYTSGWGGTKNISYLKRQQKDNDHWAQTFTIRWAQNLDWKAIFQMFHSLDCARPEIIYTHPTEGIWISCWIGGSVRPKHLKGVGGLRKKSLLWGRYGYFLESHITRSSLTRIGNL